MEVKTIKTDVLIIGSGGAGSRAAIEVDDAGLKATIVSKGLSFRSGCTGMAEGGYNAVFKAVDEEDSIVALRPASSTSIAALEPAPPDPTINTSVLIFLTSILIPFILFINNYLYF